MRESPPANRKRDLPESKLSVTIEKGYYYAT
uniref:Uncharacterized protein n=1 Tax=Geobacter sp. (strain M21) TaxID=443144 RepID=C6E271_GEOSM